MEKCEEEDLVSQKPFKGKKYSARNIPLLALFLKKEKNNQKIMRN